MEMDIQNKETQQTRIRVSLRLPQQVAEELMKAYAEPNLSKAIRKAIIDILKQKGVDIDFSILQLKRKSKYELPDITEVF